MVDWIDTYRALLAELRQKDTSYSVHGSQYHEYRLNPPLGESQLVEVEARFECSVPTDYRRFVLEVSDGGAGPGTGIFPLSKAVELSNGLRDFPFVSEYDFYPPGGGPYAYDDMHSGSLVLANYGCSMFAMLVVRGASTSQVWYDGEDYVKPLATRFSDWLLDWANSALNDLRVKDGR